MNKPIIILKLFFFILSLSAASVFAQTDKLPANPSYEVVLQLLVASNKPGEKNPVPASLANVVKKLKSTYSYADYRVTSTFLQRTSDSVDYKSLLNDFSQNQDRETPVFSEWSLRNLKNLPGTNGRGAIQFEIFKFGARIPVTTERPRDESGKSAPVVAYESIGLTTTRLGLNENEPTVVGTLATSKPEELLFLVLTVKPVE